MRRDGIVKKFPEFESVWAADKMQNGREERTELQIKDENVRGSKRLFYFFCMLPSVPSFWEE